MGKMPWESREEALRSSSTAASVESTKEAQPKQEAKYDEAAFRSRDRSCFPHFLRRFKPSDIGCLIIVLFVGMFIAFFVQDLFTGRFFDENHSKATVPAATVEAVSSTKVTPPSLILLGTAFDGIIYYFDSPNGIFHQNKTAGDPEPIALFPDYEAVHWSPSRSQLALVIHNRTDALPRLYILNLKSPPVDNKPLLVTHRDADGFPADFGLRADSPVNWSRDEQYIAFVAYNQVDKAALFVTDIPTGTVRRLTEGSEPVTSIAWETYTDTQGIADERIAYVLLRDGKEFTYSIEENGGNNNPWQR